jgi:hypothetical protein
VLNEKDAVGRAGLGDVEAMLMTPPELVHLVERVGNRLEVSR